ncbi:interferon gamma receptor 2 precursor [Larimichthys crocea]|uniref:interferon gamma receptor 2 precursor n=1 Tax=Larimichthys crocea TaxID=215358 RepID=UPI00054BC58C|nr:interferon gamma receptor 2 precursor [Larimichthys crocea]
MTPSMKLLTGLLIQVIARALSEVLPPQNIHVDKWLVTWTPATEDDVRYTVQYNSFDEEKLIDVPGCVNIALNSCNIASAQAEDEQGCLRLHVRAERRGVKSTAVEACSRHGDDCSPEVNLIARPGFLTVMLRSNHSLAKEHGGHAVHRVYYGKEGEPLEDYEDDEASVSLHGLEEGVRYCMKVQYMVFGNPAGPPSCIKCELIPKTKEAAGLTGIIVPVVAVVFLLALSVMAAYVLIYHYEKIKLWLQPPCEIPPHFHINPLPERYHPVPPSEERCDVISRVTLDDV